MKILDDPKKPVIIDSVRVEHECHVYRRIQFSDNSIEWRPLTFDGEVDDTSLETAYQQLIKT